MMQLRNSLALYLPYVLYVKEMVDSEKWHALDCPLNSDDAIFLSAEKLSEDWLVSRPRARHWQHSHPLPLSWDDTSGELPFSLCSPASVEWPWHWFSSQLLFYQGCQFNTFSVHWKKCICFVVTLKKMLYFIQLKGLAHPNKKISLCLTHPRGIL